MTRPASVTKEGVLALLSRHSAAALTQTEIAAPGPGLTQAEIAAPFGVTAEAAGNVIRFLLSTGDIVISKKIVATLYYSISTTKHVAEVTPPPYVNIWTKPLQYNFRAHADLAMAARSA